MGQMSQRGKLKQLSPENGPSPGQIKLRLDSNRYCLIVFQLAPELAGASLVRWLSEHDVDFEES